MLSFQRGPLGRDGLQWGLVVAALLAGPGLRAQTAPSWEDLEARRAVIAGIEFRVGDVFDPTRPHEAHWLGRAANALHIDTREQVLRRELLFRVGEAVDARRIRETERNLRTFRFLKNAWIEPEVDGAGAVRAVVHTTDAWTLKGSAGFSQVGGQRNFGFSIHEANVLGFGKDLVLDHEQTPERSINTVHYLDRQFLGSQWTLATRYQALSDGRTRYLELVRPYRGLETPWSMSFSGESSDATESVFNLGQIAYTFHSRQESARIEGSWATAVTEGWAFRLGGGLDLRQSTFGPVVVAAGGLPDPRLRDRALRGLHVSWGLFEERFQTFTNLAGMTHPEDFNLGWEGRLSAGSYLRRLGSDVDSPFFRVGASKGWAPGTSSLVLLRARGGARHDVDGWVDAHANLTLTAYHQGFQAQTQAAYLQLDAVQRPDPASLLYLGGMEGLRGYGNHLLLGDRRWMASVEERIVTSYDWLGILQLGFVMYADAGAIRRADSGRWSRTYADVGGGLRLGNLKSSIGRVFLITVGFPLVRDAFTDRHQFIVADIVRF